MKIGTPKETFKGEARVAMTPDSALALQKLGHECLIEKGAGHKAGFEDQAYEAAGVKVVDDVFAEADIVICGDVLYCLVDRSLSPVREGG